MHDRYIAENYGPEVIFFSADNNGSTFIRFYTANPEVVLQGKVVFYGHSKSSQLVQ